jgi:ribosomal protein L13
MAVNNRVKITNDIELKDRLVAINRVTKVTKGGRTFTFSAIVVVGNEDGIIDSGDYVIVINAAEVPVTGAKETDKIYYRHSGFPGGIKDAQLKEVREKFPERIIEAAVRGMLPKNKLSSERMARLKIFAGSEHAHAAQKPEKVEVK